ncbi:Putative periplasmic protein [Helicobacter mustelae]|uniref:DUF3971 domain-containing protein n=1 Tax=Helicobacter mustelae TaxID=217 RepID=UPI0005A50C87|nr:DUF3971 domain-containing protein [Helicobacter mustelae]SQH71244.1 Putative periplasmic protein [Helicobacter mustelae]
MSLVAFFLVILILFFSGYKILSHGISVEKLAFGKVSLSKLYLKLDKKLILQVDELDLEDLLKAPAKKPLDIESISKYIRYFTWGIAYFQSLLVKKIILDPQNIANIYYDGKRYKITFPKVIADFNISEEPGRLRLNIQTLKLVNLQSQLQGRLVYLPGKNELAFDLSAIYTPTKDKIIAQGYTNLKRIHVELKTSGLKNLDFTKPFLKDLKNPVIQDWLYSKIFFDEARIESLSFDTILTQRKFLEGIEESLKGRILVKTAELSLFNNLDSLKAKEVRITIAKQKVAFNFLNPTYGSVDLEGSSAELSDLTSHPKITAFVKSQSFQYSASLLTLLENYHLHIPEISVDSPLSADLKFSIQFLQNHKHLINLGGSIETQDAQVELFSFPFFAKKINVGFDITPQYQYIYVRANHAYYYNMLNADVDGVLDIKDQSFKSRIKVYSANINTNQAINYQKPYLLSVHQAEDPSPQDEDVKIPRTFDPSKLSPLQLKKYILASIREDERPYTQEILKITNQDNFVTDLNVDFKDPENIKVLLPEFKASLLIQDHLKVIAFDDFALFSAYSPMLSYLDIKGGNARIETRDFKNFDLIFSIENMWLPFYTNDNHKITMLEFSGTINGDEIQMASLDKNITFYRKNSQNRIHIKNYNLNVNEFLDSKIPAVQQTLHGSEKEGKKEASLTKEQMNQKLEFLRQKHLYQRQHNISPQMTNIDIDGMKLSYKGYEVPTDEINIRFRDQRTLASLTYKNGIANVDFLDGSIYIKASNFSADFINMVAKKELLHGGLFTLIGAYKDSIFSGELKMQNTLFKNFVVLQNLISLIDTIPSLVVFRNPNLGVKGYEVSQGSVIFGINKDFLGLEKIHLIGDTMDIDGSGIVQFKNKDMNINLQVSTIKNLSSILSKIPIIGYLILGSSGKISTNVSVSGTWDHPKTSVSLAEDVITAPFKILRRAFQPLTSIVDEIKNEMDDNGNHQEGDARTQKHASSPAKPSTPKVQKTPANTDSTPPSTPTPASEMKINQATPENTAPENTSMPTDPSISTSTPENTAPIHSNAPANTDSTPPSTPTTPATPKDTQANEATPVRMTPAQTTPKEEE